METFHLTRNYLIIFVVFFLQALIAARVHSDVWHCEKAMRNILSYQDEEGSFGLSILANVQITPSLLGASMTHLKKFSCPSKGKYMSYIRAIKNIKNIALRWLPTVS